MADDRKPAVLVADDVWSVRESISIALQDAGYEAFCVSNGDEAAAALRTRTFDVLVCDLWMPGQSGIQILRTAIRDYPALRLIAMTGGGPGMTLEGATSLAEIWGAERVFLKPFDERALIAYLRETDGR